MNEQIQKVTYYIENYLDDELDVKTLAKVAGYSPFHFCRIFKIYIGESAMSYATRLKLERAAGELTFGKKSMIEVALDAGFQTPTGFLKAFKKRFGTTPTEYKSGTEVLLERYKEIKMNTPKIVEREATDVVFVRELGDYKVSSQKAWEKLSSQMHGLEEKFKETPPQCEMTLGIGQGEAFGICHDDPQIADEKNMRYDAALAWGTEEVKELKKYGFETKSIVGGRYATVFYRGASNSEDSWYGLYRWIEENGYSCRDEPSFEKYLNAATETDMNNFETEVYVPIV